MCNYCQTSSVSCNAYGNTSRWHVQRICYDCNGNIHVVVSNGCVCRRLTCGVRCGCSNANETNTTATNGNGCFGCVRNNTNTGCFGGCARATATQDNTGCEAATQNADSYYVRLYGLNSNGNGRGCGCGCSGVAY